MCVPHTTLRYYYLMETTFGADTSPPHPRKDYSYYFIHFNPAYYY